MKLSVFKKLIKEAVVEAINEEIPTIINEVMVYQNKQSLNENRTISFNSNDINTSTVKPNQLDPSARQQLAQKIGGMMGYNTPTQTSNLQIINKIDETTGEKVNPYLAFIQDAANNMSAMDRSGLRNLDQ